MVHLFYALVMELNSTAFKYILCYSSSEQLEHLAGPHFSFKYILCYGSSFFEKMGRILWIDLNTSYVMVHLERNGNCESAAWI